MNTLDVAEPRYAPYCGTYGFGDGRVIFVGGLLGATLLTLHDFASRRIGALAVDPDTLDAFRVGPSLLVTEPHEITLAFERDDAGAWRGVRYATPDGAQGRGTRIHLTEEEVTFANADVTLAGTLFLPDGPGPHPAVVLVHGSGPQTRACVRLHAEYFARHGTAALAYDKRGAGRSSAGRDGFRELARDALAGARTIAAHPAIDSRRIGLCGSSQGGWIAPLAAVEAPAKVAFVMLVAGPAVSIAEQNRQNVEHSMRAAGFPDEQIAAGVRQALAFNALVRTGEGWEEFRTLVRRAEVEGWAKYALGAHLTEPPSRPTGGPRRGMDADPCAVLEQIGCPVLALFGDRDTVVPAVDNAPLMEAALRRSGHPGHRVVVMPGANHLFHEAHPSGSVELTRAFFPEYLETMVRWLAGLSYTARVRHPGAGVVAELGGHEGPSVTFDPTDADRDTPSTGADT